MIVEKQMCMSCWDPDSFQTEDKHGLSEIKPLCTVIVYSP